MEDLRRQRQEKDLKSKFLFSRIRHYIWKNKWWIISILIIVIIVSFPSSSGQAIGTWFHNFVGNLIKFGKL